MSIKETALDLVFYFITELPKSLTSEEKLKTAKKLGKWYCKSKMKVYEVELQKERGMHEGLAKQDPNFAVVYGTHVAEKRVVYYERLIKFYDEVSKIIDDAKL